MNFLRKYILGILLVISWAIQAYPILTINPQFENLAREIKKIHESASKELKPSDSILLEDGSIEKKKNAVEDLKRQWIIGIMLIIAGLISSVLALLQLRYWKLPVILTSIIFLSVWYSSGSLSMYPIITAIQLKWMTAKTFHHEIDFFIRDVALPLFYIWVVIFLSYKITWSKIQNHKIKE